MVNVTEERTRQAQLTHALQQMDDDDRYESYAPIVWDALNSAEREVLNHLLYQGPVCDGNVISKQARDALITYGLAVRVCCYGESGFTGCSYLGETVFKAGKAEPFTIKAPNRA
jgi:hypothetical protein